MISGITQQSVDTPDGAEALVLRPHGELDLASIASLESAVMSALHAAGPQPGLIVDLSEVSVLHPVVLGVLLDARRRCRKAGGALVLVVTAPEVTTVLGETGVASLCEVTAELSAAVQRLSQR
ncbi:MAG: STAS domain-containing protein [Acidimicrobiaceae bacterium]|nr:STAS domain-containing protein [Acidimicrobiaceae bacterium]